LARPSSKDMYSKFCRKDSPRISNFRLSFLVFD
jgi:hypothetical protein